VTIYELSLINTKTIEKEVYISAPESIKRQLLII
jgi:hypothetical protein